LIRWILGWSNGGRKKSTRFNQQIPDFGGVVVKADSEGRSGPSSYGRTPADAANVIARASPSASRPTFSIALLFTTITWTGETSRTIVHAPRMTSSIPLTDNLMTTSSFRSNMAPLISRPANRSRPLFGGLEKTNQGNRTANYAGIHRAAASIFVFLPPMVEEILVTRFLTGGVPRLRAQSKIRFSHIWAEENKDDAAAACILRNCSSMPDSFSPAAKKRAAEDRLRGPGNQMGPYLI